MTEKEINENYIRNKLEGICQDCMWLEKTVPIINEMLSKTYISGLEQGKFDREMLKLENEHLLRLAKKMHLYIFLHTADEQKAYDELGLTDEENAMLGYSGEFRLEVKEENE